MNGNTMQPVPRVDDGKPQGLYKITLWITVIAVAVAAFLSVIMILVTDFSNSYAARLFSRILFITWQVFWFGILSVFLSREHDRTTMTLSRVTCILGIILNVVLLTIGVIQALEDGQLSAGLENPKMALSILLYSCIFSVFILRGDNSIRTVAMAKNVTVWMLGIFDLIAMILILTNFASVNEMLARFWAVFFILACAALVVIEILKSMNGRPNNQRPYMVQSPNTMNGQPMPPYAQPPYPQQYPAQPPYAQQPPYPQQPPYAQQPPYPQQPPYAQQPPYPQPMGGQYYGAPMTGNGPMPMGAEGAEAETAGAETADTKVETAKEAAPEKPKAKSAKKTTK